jgi:hypothetical protein
MMSRRDQETPHRQAAFGQVEDAVICGLPAPALALLERPAIGSHVSQQGELPERPLAGGVIGPAADYLRDLRVRSAGCCLRARPVDWCGSCPEVSVSRCAAWSPTIVDAEVAMPGDVGDSHGRPNRRRAWPTCL